MNVEKQIPLKETCLALHKAGIEFDSAFWWHDNPTKIDTFDVFYREESDDLPVCDAFFPAPTFQELVEKIPEYIIRSHHLLIVYPFIGGSEVFYRGFEEDSIIHENLAEALALLFLWLHNEGHFE